MPFHRRIWLVRWSLLRLFIAASLLWFFTADTGARLARMQMAALPDFDHVGEAHALRAQGRFAEAIMVIDAGLPEATAAKREALLAERDACASEQSSLLRRAGDLGMGAISGSGQSLESLVGAVAADFFVVGDIRDLLIQGTRLAFDGEADPLIVALSGVGLATTLAPEIDWAPSLLKIARKTGAMTKSLGDAVLSMIRNGEKADLSRLFSNVASIARRATPGGAIRALKHADHPEDVAKLAAFLERNEKNGAGFLALYVGGRDTIDAVKGATNATRAGVEATVTAAAKKGPEGFAWLRSGAASRLLRPHPIIGLAKGIYKGNIQTAVERLLELAAPAAWWLVPLLGAWAFVESAVLVRRWRASGAEAGGRGVPAVA